MTFPGLRLTWFLLLAASAGAASFEGRVELLFRPPLGDQMALAPDGKHLAYTMYEAAALKVIVLDIEHPHVKKTLNVADPRAVDFSQEKGPVQLRFLRWATANRLVVAPTEEKIVLPGKAPPKISAPIFAVNADGQNPTTLVDADDFAVPLEQTLPVTFDEDGLASSLLAPEMIPRNPQIIGFEPSNREELLLRLPPIGRTIPPESVSLNVLTGRITGLDMTKVRGANDGRLPVDAALRREVDRDLQRKFPLRQVAIIDWSTGMEHVLARVSGGSDAGRIFVYQRPLNLVLEIARSAPWLKSSDLNETRFVEFDVPPGVRLSGYITWPRAARLKPPPLLVRFPEGFPGHAETAFDAEAQVLADLGFVVLRLNHRYERAVPAGERELARTAIDRISVDDAATVIQRVATQFPQRKFDAKHVATFGRGFGGYLAVRALQLRPEVFRAGIAIDAPMDLRSWLYPMDGAAARDLPRDIFTSDGAPWAKLSVRENVEALKSPVYLLAEPKRNEAVDLSVDAVQSALKRLKRPVDALELDPAFRLGLPVTRASVYRKIEEFLNLHLYDYQVKIGPATEVKP